MLINPSISADEFHSLTRQLLGLPISRPWRGYGSALFLELGPLTRQYKPSGRPRAEASIGIQWSWRVERERSIQFGSWSTNRKIDAGILRLQERRIEDITLVGRLPEISISLSGSLWLHSFMTAEGQPEWVIFFPDRTWLAVQRGRIAHKRSNQSDSM